VRSWLIELIVTDVFTPPSALQRIERAGARHGGRCSDSRSAGSWFLVPQVRGDGRDAAAPVGDAGAAGLPGHVRAVPGQLALLDELLHPALDGVLLVVFAAVGREHEGAVDNGQDP